MAGRSDLEVRAPTLSRIPLFVEPIILHKNSDSNRPKRNKAKTSKVVRRSAKQDPQRRLQCENYLDADSNSGAENDIFDEKWPALHQDREEPDESDSTDDDDADAAAKPQEPVSDERRAIWKATEQFLGHPVEFRNVAHAIVPIRASSSKSRGKAGPQLEVDIIVHGPRDDDDDDEEEEEVEDLQNNLFDDGMSQNGDLEPIDGKPLPMKHYDDKNKAASMVLIRMVNKIPLLDSAEAVACGLVQGLSSKKRMWNSFGLNVNLKVEPSNVNKLLLFEVTDSEQVAPFFKSGAHNLLEQDEENDAELENDADDNDSFNIPADDVTKRKRNKLRHRNLLPASVRIGNILVIAQIHAEPTSLPLPTLSKVSIGIYGVL